MGLKCGVTLKRWFCIFIFISLALIIAGIIFIIYGALNYESTTVEERYTKTDRLGAVIDAGGSATRLIVYSYSDKKKTYSQIGQTPLVCEEEGIDHYIPESYDTLRNKLQTCLQNPFTRGLIPGGKKVPLYMAASGGMRLLKKRNETLSKMTMKEVKKILDASSFDIKYVEVITGEKEAFWDWYGINTMKTADKRKGVIDVGSSSIQIAFEPQPNTQGPSKYLVKAKTVDGETKLYQNSYLCYGTTEMEKRLVAKLIASSGYKTVTENPCFFKGHNMTYKSDDLFKSPCVTGDYAKDLLGESIEPPPSNSSIDMFTVRGTSNQNNCSSRFADIINLECKQGPCGMNGAYQPPVYGIYLGISSLFYTARHMGILNGGDLAQYKQKRDEICSKTWGQTKQDKYAPRRCFDASYTYFILTKGFKFPEDSKQIIFTQQDENKVNVRWSLGLIEEKREEMYKRRGLPLTMTIITRSPNYLVLIGVGVVFLIIGSILLISTVKSRRKGRDLVSTNDVEDL